LPGALVGRARADRGDRPRHLPGRIGRGPVESSAADPNAIVNPILLVEVLSDSTEAYDRGQKASHYRRIPALHAYLLVSPHESRLELQVREADGRWRSIEVAAGQHLDIDPLGITLDVDEVYREPSLT
jgi:Uma2 family endonuclease